MGRTWANGTAGGTPLSADNLNGIEADLNRSVKKWVPATSYTQGEAVVAPNGGLYTARQSHTSGQTFTDTSWLLSQAFAPALPPGGTASRFLRGDWTWQPIEDGGGSSEAGFPAEVVLDPANVAGPVGTKVLIPTPQNSVDGEACHPSVLFFPDGWNGFKYWMAFTPYPGGNDDHEDPCIVTSQDGITWVVPPGQVNPIDDADGQPSYNSDTDLKMGPDGVMYLFWRYFNVNQVGYEENLYYSTSTDGVTWAPKKLFWQSDKTLLSLVSPSMIFEDGRWIMYAVDIVTSPNRVVRVVNTGADPEMYWGEVETLTTGAPTAGKEPWHLYVIKFGGRYYMLRADCTLDQNGSAPNLQFQMSADGKVFVGSGAEAIPQVQAGQHEQLYRATMVPAISGGKFGFRVWYTGWTSSPQKWWIFRTFISTVEPTRADDSGTANSGTLAASTGFISIPVTFKSGRFKVPPQVLTASDNGRVITASTSITKDGFTLTANNWTPGTATATLRWVALEMKS